MSMCAPEVEPCCASYIEAFTRIEMTTPEGLQVKGVGTWETLSMGRYAPLGLKGMYDTP